MGCQVCVCVCVYCILYTVYSVHPVGWLCSSQCFPSQTGDLGLDMGAQGDPLAYRQDGECLFFFIADAIPSVSHLLSHFLQIYKCNL